MSSLKTIQIYGQRNATPSRENNPCDILLIYAYFIAPSRTLTNDIKHAPNGVGGGVGCSQDSQVKKGKSHRKQSYA